MASYPSSFSRFASLDDTDPSIHLWRFRLARWIMAHRATVSAVFVLVTIVFIAGLPRVQIRTVFRNLLPQDDPFVQVYVDHHNFGNPLTMWIMVKRKHGDIYHAETLSKVWKLTRDIDLAPHVDHYQITSITTERLRFIEATSSGINMRPVMDDVVPTTPAQIAEFRHRLESSPNVRGFYVSADESATLVNATFQDSIEYGAAFDFAQQVVRSARDADHEVYLAGQPVLIGWVYQLQRQTYRIFAITVGALIVALVLYMRNVAGIVTPILCAGLAAIWGFGFIGWIHRPIEPLLMIVPLLLVARSFSHCVQFTERYYEMLVLVRDRVRAAEVTMAIMMAPSILGILTDVFGIILIAVAPIKTMEYHALFCGAWALWIIPTGVFLSSILLSYLPVPRNIEQIVGGREKEAGIHRLQGQLLDQLSHLTRGRAARYTAAAMVVITVFAIAEASKITVGNPVEGSNLLWSDSDFNRAVHAINAAFPGVNTLEIILEAKRRDPYRRVVLTSDVAKTATALQTLMETNSTIPPRATRSFADDVCEGNRLFSGGNPKWLPLDPSDVATAQAGLAITYGRNPVDFANSVDMSFQDSTVSFWYPDNKQETVDSALAAARHAVAQVGGDHPDFRVRLGTGSIALQQSMNNVVRRYHWVIIGFVNLSILLMSAIAYRAVVAAVLLLVPVNLSNVLLLATMHGLGVGLDINAVIVAVLGVGVGIDYGIYLLSRTCEELVIHDDNWQAAIHAAMTTTGKAIMFTASIMLVGILPWYALSDLKFMADMGLLLVAVMLINMLLSLVMLPLLINIVRPRFATRRDLLVTRVARARQQSA